MQLVIGGHGPSPCARTNASTKARSPCLLDMGFANLRPWDLAPRQSAICRSGATRSSLRTAADFQSFSLQLVVSGRPDQPSVRLRFQITPLRRKVHCIANVHVEQLVRRSQGARASRRHALTRGSGWIRVFPNRREHHPGKAVDNSGKWMIHKAIRTSPHFCAERHTVVSAPHLTAARAREGSAESAAAPARSVRGNGKSPLRRSAAASVGPHH